MSLHTCRIFCLISLASRGSDTPSSAGKAIVKSTGTTGEDWRE
jgi:hypothetical protein